MKKIYLLVTVLFLINTISAQHKTLTLYYSGNSTNVVSISNLDSMVIFICGVSKVSYEGKDYNTVLIGDQCWLKENLDVGNMINSTSNGYQQINNGITEKYCYNNNPANCETYGGLYEWSEAMQYSTTPGTRGICPPGWHIPTLAEFETLKATVNNDANSLKAIGQGYGQGTGTNTSGFSALLTGRRNPYGSGSFTGLGTVIYFWISTEYLDWVDYAYDLQLFDSSGIIGQGATTKDYGFSVRCIKD